MINVVVYVCFHLGLLAFKERQWFLVENLRACFDFVSAYALLLKYAISSSLGEYGIWTLLLLMDSRCSWVMNVFL